MDGLPECDAWATGDGADPAPRACVRGFSEEARLSLRLLERKERKNRTTEQVVETFSGGIGQHGQAPFEVDAPWELRWVATGSFYVYVVDDDGKLVRTAAEQKRSGSGTAKQTEGGTVRLEMNAGGPWEVSIVEFVKDFTYEYDVVGEIKVSNPYPFEIDVDLSIDDEAPRTERIPAGDYSLFSVPTKLGPYEERKDAQDLLRAFGSISISRVVNASDAAATARSRREADREANKAAKEEALERKRERASDQMSTASEERAARQQRRHREEEDAIAAADDEARRQRKRLVLAGTLTTIAGVGGAGVLLGIGIPRRTEAKAEVAKYDHIVAPDFTEQAARGAAQQDLRSANSMLVLGGVTLGATIIISSVLFRLAGKLNDNRASSAILPTVSPDGAGLSLVGRF